MKITEHTPIHYFIRNEVNDSFHKIELEAYLEIPQSTDVSKFRCIEDIRLFNSKDMDNHEIITFQCDGGRNTVVHSWANNLKDLVEYKESDASICRFKKTDKESYLILRETVFRIYMSHPKTDFDKLEIGSQFNKIVAMLNKNEYRIGNLVQDAKGNPCKVEEISPDHGVKAYSGMITKLPLSPIPLTEEWLLKFGFEGDENQYDIGLSNGDGVDLSVEFAYGTTCLKRKYVEDWLIEKYKHLNKVEDFCYIKHPKYVHELQNLYFSLTGEELNIKQ